MGFKIEILTLKLVKRINIEIGRLFYSLLKTGRFIPHKFGDTEVIIYAGNEDGTEVSNCEF